MDSRQPELSTAAFYDGVTLEPGVAKRRTDEFSARLNWSREQLQAYQQERLKAILQHAAAASPYYREKIGSLVAANAPPVEVRTVLSRS